MNREKETGYRIVYPKFFCSKSIQKKIVAASFKMPVKLLTKTIKMP